MQKLLHRFALLLALAASLLAFTALPAPSAQAAEVLLSQAKPLRRENRAGHSVKQVCELMKVSRTACSTRRSGLPGPRAVRDAELTEQITEAHARSRGTYGAPRVHALLTREGAGCDRRRVARLMRAAGLQGRHSRRRQATTIPDPGAALRPGLIARDCSYAPRRARCVTAHADDQVASQEAGAPPPLLQALTSGHRRTDQPSGPR